MDKGVCETSKETENFLVFFDATFCVQKETFGTLLEFLDGSWCDESIGHLGRSGDIGMCDYSIRRHDRGGGLYG